MDLYGVYLGDRLGLYRALAEAGPLTSSGLAAAAGIHERYAREWLEQQAATGILEVDDAGADALERRFSLPEGHDEALLDETSLNYAAPFGRLRRRGVRPLDELLAAFRSGDGVPYEDYGADLYEGQEAFTRPLFSHLLGSEWLPAVPRRARASARPTPRLGSPTSPAAAAGRASPSHARIRSCTSTVSISTRRRSRRPARTSSGAAWRIASRSTSATPPIRRWRASTTSSRSSRRSTTCPARWTCSRRCAACSPTAARSSSATSAPRTASGARQRPRAPLLRLQRAPLPAGGHGRRRPGRDGHRHARGHGPRVRRGGGLRRLRGAADRERLLALLPAYTVS